MDAATVIRKWQIEHMQNRLTNSDKKIDVKKCWKNEILPDIHNEQDMVPNKWTDFERNVIFMVHAAHIYFSKSSLRVST